MPTIKQKFETRPSFDAEDGGSQAVAANCNDATALARQLRSCRRLGVTALFSGNSGRLGIGLMRISVAAGGLGCRQRRQHKSRGRSVAPEKSGCRERSDSLNGARRHAVLAPIVRARIGMPRFGFASSANRLLARLVGSPSRPAPRKAQCLRALLCRFACQRAMSFVASKQFDRDLPGSQHKFLRSWPAPRP